MPPPAPVIPRTSPLQNGGTPPPRQRPPAPASAHQRPPTTACYRSHNSDASETARRRASFDYSCDPNDIQITPLDDTDAIGKLSTQVAPQRRMRPKGRADRPGLDRYLGADHQPQRRNGRAGSAATTQEQLLGARPAHRQRPREASPGLLNVNRSQEPSAQSPSTKQNGTQTSSS